MKNFIILFFLAAVLTFYGCATQQDMSRVEGRLGSDIISLRKTLGENSEALASSRRLQADASADMVELRDSIQGLRGATERLNAKMSSLESKTGDPGVALNDISKRLAYIENYLGIGKMGEKAAEKEIADSASTQKGEPKGREEAYASAYAIFQNGQYDAAKEEFQKFLKNFPNSEYSDNAQFWIGECDYFQGKYEQAIIEYESVVQNYPKGNKVPNAILKQALSFLKLDDKDSAKLLLQGIIKDYPNTTPASVARKKLLDLK